MYIFCTCDLPRDDLLCCVSPSTSECGLAVSRSETISENDKWIFRCWTVIQYIEHLHIMIRVETIEIVENKFFSEQSFLYFGKPEFSIDIPLNFNPIKPAPSKLLLLFLSFMNISLWVWWMLHLLKIFKSCIDKTIIRSF